MAEELTDDQLDNLSAEELEEHEKSINEKDVKGSDEDTEKLEEELDSDESEKEETQESKEETEKPPEGDKRFEGKTKEEVEEAYFKAEQGYGKQGQELGELRKSKIELLEKIKVLEEPTKPEEVQEQYDPEKYANLLVENPVAAAEYQRDYLIVPTIEKREQEKQVAVDTALAEKTQQEELENSVKALNEFSELEGYEDIGSEEEAYKFGSYIRETFNMPKGGYTVELIKKAYNLYNPEKMEMNIKRDLMKKIEEGAPEVKTLSTASDAKVKSVSMPKGLNIEEQAEWAEKHMTMEEMDKQLDEAEQ